MAPNKGENSNIEGEISHYKVSTQKECDHVKKSFNSLLRIQNS